MQIKVSITDAQGRSSTLTLTLDASITTLADAQTAYEAWETDFLAASGAGISKASVIAPLDVTPTAADAGSNLDEGFWLTYLMEDGDNFTQRFPAPAKTAGAYDFITAGAVNIADTQVSDLVANYVTGADFRIGKFGLRIVDTLLSGYLEKP